MEIAEGATAMISWYEMVYVDKTKAETIKNNLLKYCKLDTMVMVRIFKALFELNKNLLI